MTMSSIRQTAPGYPFQNLADLFLEEFWSTQNAKWQLVKLVSAKGGYEGYQMLWLLCQWDSPEATIGGQPAKDLGPC